MSHSDQAAAVTHEHRDDVGAKMGMWLFLLTEILLFGGMFLIYAVYRLQYTEEYRLAAMELNTTVGTINTIILLTSSLTVALAIAAIQKKNKFLSVLMLALTIMMAFMFMINKFFEWSAKFSHGIYLGADEWYAKPDGEKMFFSLYYLMTGLHGIHVLVGIVLLSVMLVLVVKNKIRSDKYVLLENSGLYWHLVDLIWIFLFPLFYLIQ